MGRPRKTPEKVEPVTRMATTSPYIVSSYGSIAEFFGVNGQTVALWRRSGMPVIRKGQYDLKGITQWKFNQLKTEQDFGSEDSNALEMYRQVKTKLAELELQHKTGVMVELETVIADWRDAAIAIRNALDNIQRQSPDIADELHKQFEDVEKTLKKKWEL